MNNPNNYIDLQYPYYLLLAFSPKTFPFTCILLRLSLLMPCFSDIWLEFFLVLNVQSAFRALFASFPSVLAFLKGRLSEESLRLCGFFWVLVNISETQRYRWNQQIIRRPWIKRRISDIYNYEFGLVKFLFNHGLSLITYITAYLIRREEGTIQRNYSHI